MSTDKISTLIVEVDLQCEKCSKKIHKVLRELKRKENISKTDYDDKKNMVTISGPFDPDKVYKKLKCKACHTIKDIKIVKPEEKKPEVKKPEEKKPEEKKPEEKKPEVKKPVEEKKPEEKKEKPKEEKKPEEKKPEEKKEKPNKEEAKAPAAALPPWSSTTTVNLQFMNICNICYPWPCSEPTHWGAHQTPQHQPHPQWPTCEGMVPMPTTPGRGHHQHSLPWGKCSPCGGPSLCGGCGSCHGGASGMHGWPVVPPTPTHPMCCPGPSLCRGCNGCKIVHESKFSYEEYPSSACAIM